MVKVKVKVIVLGTQTKFPEIVVKIREAGASQWVIPFKVKVIVKVKVNVKVKVKVKVLVKIKILVLSAQIIFTENVVKIRQVGASQ